MMLMESVLDATTSQKYQQVLTECERQRSYIQPPLPRLYQHKARVSTHVIPLLDREFFVVAVCRQLSALKARGKRIHAC